MAVVDRDAAALQNKPVETTSPPLRLPRLCQAVALIESLTNCTWPSQKSELTPAGCRLRVVTFRDRFCQSAADLSLCGRPPRQSYLLSLGGLRWLYMLCPGAP